MKNSLYNSVYEYLTKININSEGYNQFNYNMTYLSNLIQYRVYEMMQIRGYMTEMSQRFLDIAKETSQPLKVLIAGEFKTGKSTFINTLLGREILKSDVTPATAVVTHICYGEKEEMIVEFMDGSKWYYPVTMLEILTSEGNDYYSALRRRIKIVYVTLPMEFLKCVTLIDSPGINVNIDYHIKATQSALENSDLVIWLVSMSCAAKKSEINEMKKLPKYLKPIVVFNCIDLIDSEEEDIDDAIDCAKKRVGNLAKQTFAMSAFCTQKAIKNNDFKQYKEYRWGPFLEYFLNEICYNWYVWKNNAILGKLNQYNDNEIAENYEKYSLKIKDYKDIIENSKHKMWITIEQCEKERDVIAKLVFNSIKEPDMLISSSTGNIDNMQLERITSMMKAIELIIKEAQLLENFDDNSLTILRKTYLHYQQMWYCLLYQINAFQYNKNEQEKEKLNVLAYNWTSYNASIYDIYTTSCELLYQEKDRYYEKYKKEIEFLKKTMYEKKQLENKLEGYELYSKIYK